MADSDTRSSLAMTRDRRLAAAIGLVVGLIVFGIGYAVERENSFAQSLRALRLSHELRRTAIEDHIASATSDVFSMSRSQRIRDSYYRMEAVWLNLGDFASSVLRAGYLRNPGNSVGIDVMEIGWSISSYREQFEELERYCRDVLANFDFHDVLLIDRKGNVVFSVGKEDDFGTNLVDGPYAETALGYVFERVVQSPERVVTSYVERYGPSGDIPALFVAADIPDINGRVAGVVVAQTKMDAVDRIARAPDQVIGSLTSAVIDSDFLLLAGELPSGSASQLKTVYQTESIRRGFAGFSGDMIIDDDAGKRLSVFSPLVVGERAWILVTEMSIAETLKNIRYDMIVFFSVSLGLLFATVARILIATVRKETAIVE